MPAPARRRYAVKLVLRKTSSHGYDFNFTNLATGVPPSVPDGPIEQISLRPPKQEKTPLEITRHF